MGIPLLEAGPEYFDGAFWKKLVEFWESEAHQRRSKTASENRGKQKHKHSAGAKSFMEVEDVSI